MDVPLRKIMKKLKGIMAALALCSAAMGMQAQKNVIVVHDTVTNKNESILLPLGLQEDADTLARTWLSRLYLTKDSTATPNYNPLYTPDVYESRLKRLPCVIPMTYNATVQKLIDLYTEKLRERVSYMLGLQNFYIPIFETALDAYHLPLELKYLPVIEAALDAKATNTMGQAGLWQLSMSDARRMNLVVNSLVDDRRNVYKASWAAAKYLDQLYKKYKDWNLVIVAYNVGENVVDHSMKRNKGEWDYWKNQALLPTDARGFVPAFIAANYVMNYYCDHNILPMKVRYPEPCDTVMVQRPLSLEQVAEYCHTPLEGLHALNPQYRTNMIPGWSGSSSLCMPQEKINFFLDHEEEIYAYRAKELLGKKALALIDQYQQPSEPQPTVMPVKKVVVKKKSSRSSRAKTVRVRRGDSLYKIALRYKTTVNKIKRLNGLKNNNLRPGQRLRVR